MSVTAPQSILMSYAPPDGQRAADAIRNFMRGRGLLNPRLAKLQDLVADRQRKGWRDHLDATITKADHLVPVISPQWLDTEFAPVAVHAARAKGVKITPVLFDRKINTADLPNWLQDAPVCRIDMDATNAAAESHFQRFFRTIFDDTSPTEDLARTPGAASGLAAERVPSSRALRLDGGPARGLISLGSPLVKLTAHSLMRRLAELAEEDTAERLALLAQFEQYFPGLSAEIVRESNPGAAYFQLDVLQSPGKEEDRWSEITQTTHKKKAASLARDLAAKWRAVESVLNAVASSPSEVKAALAASAEFRKVQTDYAAAAAAIANIPQHNIATSVAAPLALPDKAPVLYRGKKLDGDALEFAAKHYAPWLEARLLDLASLEKLDKKLWNALRNEAYLGGRADETKALFPSTVEVRNARGEVRPVGELRKIWRQQQSRHRARRSEP